MKSYQKYCAYLFLLSFALSSLADVAPTTYSFSIENKSGVTVIFKYQIESRSKDGALIKQELTNVNNPLTQNATFQLRTTTPILTMTFSSADANLNKYRHQFELTGITNGQFVILENTDGSLKVCLNGTNCVTVQKIPIYNST